MSFIPHLVPFLSAQKDQSSDMIPDDSGVGLINYFTRKGQQ
jgi:hypothetical protein